MIDISFKNKTGEKPEILSAVIGADSFFYGLFTKSNSLLESKYYKIEDFRSDKMIEQILFDMHSTENVVKKIASTTKPYLHNPKEESQKLLKFFPAFQNKKVDSDLLTDQPITVDYGITKSQELFLERILGETQGQFHISTVLSNYYYPYELQKLTVFIENDIIHILYANKQKFLYYNQFHCSDVNDYLYFVMMAYKELNLDPNSIPLEISGRIDRSSPIVGILEGYIQNVNFVRSAILKVEDFNYKAKQHYYLDLFATALCV